MPRSNFLTVSWLPGSCGHMTACSLGPLLSNTLHSALLILLVMFRITVGCCAFFPSPLGLSCSL